MSRQRCLRSQDTQHWDNDGFFDDTRNSAEVRHDPQPYDHVPSAEEHHKTRDAGNHTSDTTTIVPEDAHQPPKKISWWLWFIIFNSFITLSGAVTFLSWLWFQDREDTTWRRVMLSGRSTQAITLTGVLIRAAIGSLTAIMTSMIASIAIERHGVPKSAIAEVSIARFTNAGPRSFSKLLLSGATFKGWIRILTAISLLLFLASEFTSTLLVADLRESRVSSFNQNMSYGFTLVESVGTETRPMLPIGSAFNYWLNKPSSSEIFAEYSQPGKFGEDFHDTGPSIRAFLPVALQSEREALRSFRGMARVVDTRVVCVRPTFSARYCSKDPTYPNTFFICGNVTADLSNLPQYSWPEWWDGDKEKYVATFNCSILNNREDFRGPQTWALCDVVSLGTFGSPLTNATSHENSTARSHSKQMIIDTISLRKSVYGLWNTSSIWEHLNSSGSGPWLRQWSRVRSDDGEVEEDFYFPITLCFDYAGAAE